MRDSDLQHFVRLLFKRHFIFTQSDLYCSDYQQTPIQESKSPACSLSAATSNAWKYFYMIAQIFFFPRKQKPVMYEKFLTLKSRHIEMADWCFMLWFCHWMDFKGCVLCFWFGFSCFIFQFSYITSLHITGTNTLFHKCISYNHIIKPICYPLSFTHLSKN